MCCLNVWKHKHMKVKKFVIKWPVEKLGTELLDYLRGLSDEVVQAYMDAAVEVRCWSARFCFKNYEIMSFWNNEMTSAWHDEMTSVRNEEMTSFGMKK